MRSHRSPLLLLGLSALAAGCGSLLSPADEGVALEIRVEPTTLPVGDTARVTLTLRNGGSEHIMFERGSGSATCLVTFHLVDRDTEVEQPCGVAPSNVALSAHGSWSHTYRWLPRSSTDDEEPLPPGRYRLVGHVHDEETSLESRPVTFRVVPR